MTVENTPELMSAKILNLPDAARVWVYQSTRPFSEKETVVLKSQINGFVSEWTAHSQQLAAVGDVLMNQFIVLAVDEKQAGASGCSIDKSVHFLQSIENQFNTQLFDRLNFAYLNDNNVEIAPSTAFSRLYTEGVISDDTLVFDNLVATISDLKTKWMKPLRESWHRRFVR